MPATLDHPRKPVKLVKPAEEEHEILFQHWFKSVGPRTYAAQVKRASNGNHYLVLTEGKRDKESGQVRKNRLFIYSEDFKALFDMLHQTALFIRSHPVPPEVASRQKKFWSRSNNAAKSNAAKSAARA